MNKYFYFISVKIMKKIAKLNKRKCAESNCKIMLIYCNRTINTSINAINDKHKLILKNFKVFFEKIHIFRKINKIQKEKIIIFKTHF